MLKVKDIIEVCEYTGCIVLNALGKEIENMDTKQLYELDVEHLSAKDSIVQIWTFEKWDEFINGCIEEI